MPKIRNKKTGEIIEVSEQDLPNYGIERIETGNVAGASTQPSGQIGMQQPVSTPQTPQRRLTETDLVMGLASLSPSDFTKLKSLYDIQQATDETKRQQKKDQLEVEEQQKKDEGGKEIRRDAVSLIDEILGTNTKPISGTMQFGAKVPLFATKAKSTLGKYDRLKSMLSLDNVKYLKGTGQISDREGMLLEKAALSIPEDRKVTDEDFRAELSRARNELAQELNIDPKELEVDEKTLKEKVTTWVKNEDERGFIPNLLLGEGLNLSRDLGTSLGLQGQEGQKMYDTWEQNMDEANNIIEKLNSTEDPEERKRLQSYADNLLDTVIKQSGDVSQDFSSSMEMPEWLRAGLTGLEVASTAEIPDMLRKALKFTGKKLGIGAVKEAGEETGKGAVKTIAKTSGDDAVSKGVSAVEKAKGYTPRGYLARKQAESAAKSTAKVNTDDFIKAGEKLAKKNPGAAKWLDSYKPTLKNINNVDDLLNYMQEWGDVTYKASGGAKAADRARLLNEFYKTGLNILKTEAPDVYKYRQLLRYTFELPKDTARVLWRLMVGRAALGGF